MNSHALYTGDCGAFIEAEATTCRTPTYIVSIDSQFMEAADCYEAAEFFAKLGRNLEREQAKLYAAAAPSPERVIVDDTF